MHDAAFARAAVQPPVSLLRLRLRPYSIGDELLLGSRSSLVGLKPKVVTGLADHYAAVLQGVFICAHSWDQNLQMRWELLIGLKVWLWGRYARTQDLDAVGKAFAEYRRAGSTWPPSDIPTDSGGRKPGSPFLLRLHRFIMQDASVSESGAWDYPLAMAQWRWSAYWEAQGRLEVLNEGEASFIAWCEEQDAAAAAAKVLSPGVARA